MTTPRYSQSAMQASPLARRTVVIALLAVVQASLFIPSVGGMIALGALCLFALTGVDQAIKALIISVLVTFANPVLFPAQQHVAEFKWLLLLFGLWVAIKAKSSDFRYPAAITISWVLFLSVSLYVSLVFGLSPSLSMFKLASFTLGLVTTFRLAALSQTTLDEWSDFLLVVLLWIAAVSLPLLGTAAGRFINGTGFQGVISHPQSFGTLMAALPVIGFLKSLTSSKRMTYVWMLVAILGTFLVFESESRTAMLSSFFGVCLSSALFYMSNQHRGKGRLAARAFVFCSVVVLIILASGGRDSPLIGGLGSALQKHTSGGLNWDRDTFETLLMSRAGQIGEQSDVIAERPLTGTGFGVQNISQVESSPDSTFMGIPLSSPNEPGFLPLAVQAQVGAIGSLVFWYAIWRMFKAVLKGRQLVAIGLFAVLLGGNWGEAIAFSFGGLGLFMWMILAITVRCSTAKIGVRRNVALSRGQSYYAGALQAGDSL